MLNKNFFGLLLIVSVSCGKSVDNATVETFKYSVDTVSVDSKGHLLYLDYNLRKPKYPIVSRMNFSIATMDLITALTR